MFKRIYTSVDNSDVAQKVLTAAINLAKTTNATLKVVHVINVNQVNYNVEMFGVMEIKSALLASANQVKQHVLDILKEQQFTADVAILEENQSTLDQALLKDAKAWNADLLILGSHHLGSVTHLFHGGVIEAISKASSIPMLLISKNVQ